MPTYTITGTVPRFYRASTTHKVGWEYYRRGCWFLDISLGSFSINLAKWPKGEKV